MKTVFIAMSLVVAALAAACTTSEAPVYEAQQVEVSSLMASPGYAWFPAEMSVYTPATSAVESIQSSFDAKDQKVVIFVKPACSCRGTMRLFPQIVKTLRAAGVPDANIEIWSMRSEADKQPYAPTITITDLPTIHVFRNGSTSAIVLESEYNERNADSLIAAAVTR